METVIPPEKTSGHIIQKYRFKVLSQNVCEESAASKPQKGGVQPYSFKELPSETVEECVAEEREIQEKETDTEKEEKVSETSEIAADREPSGEMMEEMLKRVDELSTELVKTQMALEKQQEEFQKLVEEERASAFEEGMEAGRAACEKELNRQIEESRSRFTAAIRALEESQQTFMKKVDTIEEELIETALDLARQVVVKEIESSAQEVALRLARLLLAEVKEASKVKLKVNPDDYEYVKANLETTKNVKIVPDPAVGAGGVVILSDIGNIDGDIMHRFERIKEAVFGTVK
ncbi:flagellar assembly protein FliH [Hydrogenimonas sp.]|uniref:flagellar assembly protein FliH n=1 Tax=Hydrogenimonas sp. TaxID=2231112 RepID=UPI00260A2DB1|nr:flagellar assembly protein FliH [Hydrogenimonas sp.]